MESHCDTSVAKHPLFSFFPPILTAFDQIAAVVSNCVGVCEGDGVVVAVCNAATVSSIWYSIDGGITFSASSNGLLFDATLNLGGRCAYRPSTRTFVAVGRGSSTIARSTDMGMSWIPVVGGSLFAVAGYGMRFSHCQSKIIH